MAPEKEVLLRALIEAYGMSHVRESLADYLFAVNRPDFGLGEVVHCALSEVTKSRLDDLLIGVQRMLLDEHEHTCQSCADWSHEDRGRGQLVAPCERCHDMRAKDEFCSRWSKYEKPEVS